MSVAQAAAGRGARGASRPPAQAPRLRTGLLAGMALMLGACALFANPGRITPGTPVVEVIRELGRPTAQYPAEAARAAGERLQYSYEPAGQRVYNLDLDAQGRVVRVEQALDEGLFAARIRPNQWTRADVLREYGPPARIIAVHNFDGVIWVWRYLSGQTWRLLYIDIDPTGVVRGWSVGDEQIDAPPEPR